MRTIIAGSREGISLVHVDYAMNSCPFLGEITRVISGGARGADAYGEQWARGFNLPITRVEPDWEKYGKRAGFLRNAEMAAEADALVLVWDGQSRGSMNMKMEAAKRGLIIHEVIFRRKTMIFNKDLPVSSDEAISLIEHGMGMTLQEMELNQMGEAECFARLGTAYVELWVKYENISREIEALREQLQEETTSAEWESGSEEEAPF